MRRRARTTLVDVARLAGVSAVTVSKVLNGKGHISPETQEKVQRAAALLGYVANTAARRLRGGATRILGMVVPELVSPYFAELARAAADAAGRCGYDLGLFTTSRDPQRERERIQSLLGGMADGLLLVVPVGAGEFLSTLEQSQVPIVLINYFGGATHLPVVRGENYEGTVALLHHLLALGHRRIGFIGGAEHSGQAKERYRAYREVMRAAGLWDEALVQPGDFTRRKGLEGARALLGLPSPPTAIFAGSDLMAFGVMEAAQERGLQVPADLSIAGFDDSPLASLIPPGLTTVAHPIGDIAEASVRLLLEAIEGNPVRDQLLEFPSRLVVRGSTAPPKTPLP
ncbi:LacI family DNA-binding transcriptional regulator [Meiothermus ruber]|uniref:Transcriptional regulator, LacI family n=1 Tax=Meiothermus ruber (strain ATCC 35948 / DSM 1279 / VKM B-1258 / 21) TaxID=504728 RepID=A0A806CV85_MEIRD|nr:LacI family DNA-binding transcriptional regulator [Meiothermus ruber]GIW38834.1 MAG: LacI family transcriptional regulator [Meiothermus sp.]ADD29307.1 transcriptional regulator, LacI family [Meiothermus ruber DSM 1279]MCL6529172.1 LacI family transcriptional regulator [Meiothermus ruber]MCX7801403.1 LacI family transcriptional regulator [Meiothermus ruber]GAO76229.1 LacI family transcriptional regulator [Meiothermus ruber H328]